LQAVSYRTPGEYRDLIRYDAAYLHHPERHDAEYGHADGIVYLGCVCIAERILDFLYRFAHADDALAFAGVLPDGSPGRRRSPDPEKTGYEAGGFFQGTVFILLHSFSCFFGLGNSSLPACRLL